MSSTGRGYYRHKSDYYITPISAIKDFLSSWVKYPPITLNPNHRRLDPCAGGDINNPMSYPEALKELGVTPDTIDIREDSRAGIIGDYLKTTTKGYDIIITNPPFDKALAIIKKALDDVNEGGYVIMLLRLNFLGSQKRFPFFQNNMPKGVYVHHKRMSFTNGGTDSIEYAHFVWKKGYRGDTKLLII